MEFLVQMLCFRKARPRHYDMVMALPLWTMFQNQFTQNASQATKNSNNVQVLVGRLCQNRQNPPK